MTYEDDFALIGRKLDTRDALLTATSQELDRVANLAHSHTATPGGGGDTLPDGTPGDDGGGTPAPGTKPSQLFGPIPEGWRMVVELDPSKLSDDDDSWPGSILEGPESGVMIVRPANEDPYIRISRKIGDVLRGGKDARAEVSLADGGFPTPRRRRYQAVEMIVTGEYDPGQSTPPVEFVSGQNHAGSNGPPSPVLARRFTVGPTGVAARLTRKTRGDESNSLELGRFTFPADRMNVTDVDVLWTPALGGFVMWRMNDRVVGSHSGATIEWELGGHTQWGVYDSAKQKAGLVLRLYYFRVIEEAAA